MPGQWTAPTTPSATVSACAQTPNEVIAAAQVEIDRAYQLGPVINSSGERAGWFPPSRWVEPEIGKPEAENWPPRQWPDIASDPKVEAYPGHLSDSRLPAPRDTRAGEGGPVHVHAHIRDGHPVHAYTRSSPGR